MSDFPARRDLPVIAGVAAWCALLLLFAWWRGRAHAARHAAIVARIRPWALRRGLVELPAETSAWAMYGGTFARFAGTVAGATIELGLHRAAAKHIPPFALLRVAPLEPMGGGVIIEHAGGDIPVTPSGDPRFDAACAVYVHDARSARGLNAEGRRRVAELFEQAHTLKRPVKVCTGEMSAAYRQGDGVSARWTTLDLPDALLDLALSACLALATPKR